MLFEANQKTKALAAEHKQISKELQGVQKEISSKDKEHFRT